MNEIRQQRHRFNRRFITASAVWWRGERKTSKQYTESKHVAGVGAVAKKKCNAYCGNSNNFPTVDLNQTINSNISFNYVEKQRSGATTATFFFKKEAEPTANTFSKAYFF